MTTINSKNWGSLAMRGMLVVLFSMTGIFTAGSKNEVQKQEEPRVYAERATELEEAGKWEAAKREIDEGLEYYPKDTDLRYLNGRYYYYAKKDLNQARYNLIKSIQSNDQHYQSKRLLVDVEDDSKHYSSSICYINELLEFQPYDRDLWRRKIALYNKIGQREEADEALRRLARIYPNDSLVINDLKIRNRENWNSRLSRGSTDDQAQELEDYLLLDPSNLSYYIDLAQIYYRTGQIERAIGTANRGLYYHKGNSELVKMAASMMAEMGNYTRALAFLKANRNTGPLYNQLLREAMEDNRARDPYESAGRLYETTKDNDALTYLLNTSVVRGYYPDAKDYLNIAYQKFGRTPHLLMMEYGLEKRFGFDDKALKVLDELYKAIPDDETVYSDYADAMLALTDHDIETDEWHEALAHINRVYEIMAPDTLKWPAVVSRKIRIYGHLNMLDSARYLYTEASDTMPRYRERFAFAYEEVAAERLKALIDNEEYIKALSEAQELLAIVPESEVALRACINMSQELGKEDLFQHYADLGYEKYPDSPYFILKEAVALQQRGKNEEALALLKPDRYNDEYVNPQLRNAYSGVTEEYAGLLLKEKMPELALEALDTALMYDSRNKELLYLKGLAYEQLKDFGKAWELQMKNYNPSNAEQQDWQQHMRYLKWKSFDDRVSASYTSAYYNSSNDELSAIAHLYSIASVSYSRETERNTYTGQISYKGRDGFRDEVSYDSGGFGLELMAQWDHEFTKRLSGFANLSYGTKYFNKIGANVGASYDLLNGWVPSLKLGYRLTSPTYIVDKNDATNIDYKRYSLVILTPGIERSWERIKASATVDLIGMSTGFYYNVGLKGKIFVNNDNVSSVGILAGFGSFPELAFFDQTAINTLSHTNGMVGLEGMYLVTNNFAISLNGSWNTYYYPVRLHFDEPLVDSYRNVFSINLGLHVAF